MKKLSINKSNYNLIKFGDVVFEPKEVVKDVDINKIKQVVGLEHLDQENIHLSRFSIMDKSISFRKKFSVGDVLFGRRRAYLKKAAQTNFSGICSGDITVMRAKKPLIPQLLPFIVNNDKFFEYAIKHSAGGLSPRVKFKDLAKYEFVLPPKKEQIEIAELLWELDNFIQKKITLMNNLRLLLFSIVNDIFSSNNKTIRIKECILENKNKKIPKGHSPYVEIGDIQLFNKLILLKQKKSVAGALLAKKGSVIVSKVRPNRGAISILNIDQVVSSGFTVLQCDEKLIINFFLFHCLAWNNSFGRLMSRLSSGTAYPTITDDDIKNFKIPLLKISKQKFFCKKLDSTYQAMLNTEDLINKTKKLSKSIIGNLF